MAAGQIYATYQHDNRDPQKADQKFKKFLEVLREQHEIVINEALFFDQCTDEETGKISWFGKPAGVVPIGDQCKLLVVDYGYSMPEKALCEYDEGDLFDWPIAEDTMAFHLFEVEGW